MMPFRGQNHRAMNGKLSGGCKVWISACSRPPRSSGATVSDTGIDTQSQRFSFCAQYRKESSVPFHRILFRAANIKELCKLLHRGEPKVQN